VYAAKRWAVACASESRNPCDRFLFDDWVGADVVDALKSIAERGAERAFPGAAQWGGPTIVDANSGYVMAPAARLRNVYEGDHAVVYTAEDYALYRRVIRNLKRQVERAFGITTTSLHFTAPTFIARLSGLNATWSPASPHDEYWHAHVDRENTAHYDYSGLLYLSDYGRDFDGGLFQFLDPTANTTVEPRRGRLLLFAASSENRHRVHRVTAGLRYVLSFWFTLDPAFAFSDFLDGAMHLRFNDDQDRGSSPRQEL